MPCYLCSLWLSIEGGQMSERNGEKSRFQINRKRAVLRRAKIRAMVASGAPAEKRPAHAKLKAAKS
jgi:hypothetical protein